MFLEHIQYYKEIDSTNKKAMREGSHLLHGTVLAADSQSAGRGRRGREWMGSKGENIYASLVLKPDFGPEKAPMLTLVMALAVTKAIEENYHISLKIKWPNDIVCQGKKLCGILTEMSVSAGKIEHVVIGFGINVNQKEFDGLPHATSLCLALGQEQDRERLLKAVLTKFENLYEQFCAEQSLAYIQKEYEAYLINLQREIQVLDPKGTYTGVAVGINEEGELLVRREDAVIETVYAGEVSVRGLYGYV